MASLLQQARDLRPSVSDEQHVVRIAADLIEEWQLEPPVSLDVVAQIQGIVRIDRVPLDVAACLVPGPDGAVIKLRQADSLERQNFSGFHEVGHTFLPGYQLQIQFRCAPTVAVARDPVEALCDLAASELLLPRRHVIPDLLEADLTFEVVQELGARYGASFEATARRVAALWREPAFVLRLEMRNKPRDVAGAPPCLRSSTFVPGGAVWPSIPQYKSLAADDPLQAVTLDGGFEGLTALRGLTDGSRVYRVVAVNSPWVDAQTGELKERVLALVTPARSGAVAHG